MAPVNEPPIDWDAIDAEAERISWDIPALSALAKTAARNPKVVWEEYEKAKTEKEAKKKAAPKSIYHDLTIAELYDMEVAKVERLVKERNYKEGSDESKKSDKAKKSDKSKKLKK